MTEDAGMIGLVIVVAGMAGSMVCGIILDKTHAYKVAVTKLSRNDALTKKTFLAHFNLYCTENSRICASSLFTSLKKPAIKIQFHLS